LASASITIANLAVINVGSINLLQVTAIVIIGAQSEVATRNVLLDVRVLRAIEDWVLASKDRVASVGGARIVVGTGDVCVNASRRSGIVVARISCANIVVVAVGRDIICDVDTSLSRITIIMSASVAVIATDGCVGTFACRWIASISGTYVVVIAIDRSRGAVSKSGVAFANLAWNVGALYWNWDSAQVARNGGVGASYSSLASI
jgi:hypothetical protein